MKNNLFILLAIVNLLMLQSCHAQVKENPAHLGDQSGVFDLDKVTFKEDINTLFSKVKYIKLPRKDTYYDKLKKQEIVRDTLAFEYKVATVDTSKVTTYFLDKSLKEDLVFFFTDKNNRFRAFSFFTTQKQDFTKRMELIDEKYKKYKIKLKPNDNLKYSNGKAYQWETPDKIISATISGKDSDGEYTCGLTVVDKHTDFSKFPINKFIYGNSVCLDNTCKE